MVRFDRNLDFGNWLACVRKRRKTLMVCVSFAGLSMVLHGCTAPASKDALRSGKASDQSNREETSSGEAGSPTGANAHALAVSHEFTAELSQELLAANVDEAKTKLVVEEASSLATSRAGTIAVGLSQNKTDQIEWAATTIGEGALRSLRGSLKEEPIESKSLIASIILKSVLNSSDARSGDFAKEARIGLKNTVSTVTLQKGVGEIFSDEEVAEVAGEMLATIIASKSSFSGEERSESIAVFEHTFSKALNFEKGEELRKKLAGKSLRRAVAIAEALSADSGVANMAASVIVSGTRAAVSIDDVTSRNVFVRTLGAATSQALDALEMDTFEKSLRAERYSSAMVEAASSKKEVLIDGASILKEMNGGFFAGLKNSDRASKNVVEWMKHSSGVFCASFEEVGLDAAKVPAAAASMIGDSVAFLGEMKKSRGENPADMKSFIGDIVKGAFEGLTRNTNLSTENLATSMDQMARQAVEKVGGMEFNAEEMVSISSVIGEQAMPSIEMLEGKDWQVRKRIARRLIKGASAGLKKLSKDGVMTQTMANRGVSGINQAGLMRLSSSLTQEKVEELALEISAGALEGAKEFDDEAQVAELRDLVNVSAVETVTEIASGRDEQATVSDVFAGNLTANTDAIIKDEANLPSSDVTSYATCADEMQKEKVALRDSIVGAGNKGYFCQRGSAAGSFAACPEKIKLNDDFTIHFFAYGSGLCELSVVETQRPDEYSSPDSGDTSGGDSPPAGDQPKPKLATPNLLEIQIVDSPSGPKTFLLFEPVEMAGQYDVKIFNPDDNSITSIFCSHPEHGKCRIHGVAIEKEYMVRLIAIGDPYQSMPSSPSNELPLFLMH